MLTGRFALLGLPIVILTAALLIGTYRYVVLFNLQVSVEGVAASMAQIFANTLWHDYRPLLENGADMGAEAVRGDPMTRALDREVRRVTAGTKVIKIKVYAVNGFTLYSTDPAQIGVDYSQRPAFLTAFGGGIFSELARRDRFEAVDGPLSDIVVLATYVPARSPDDRSRILAVLEIYTDVTELEIKVLERPEVRGAMLAIVLVLLSAFGTQLWVLRRAEARVLLEHDRRLRASAELSRVDEASRAKSMFLANMSHELRTPLNAVIGFSDILQAEMFGPIEQRRYVEYAGDINRAGRHLLRVIDDVLDLSKIEAGKVDVNVSVVDPAATIASALDMLVTESDRHGVAIRRDLPSGVPLIATDDGKLRQIVLNVVSNAIKYTGTGGSVTVRLEVASDAPAVRIVMADTGIGMSADDLAVALTPFGRVQGIPGSQRGGTGLGLPLTREFVHLLGGRFNVESAPGVGTTVTVDLPLAPIAA